LGGVLLTQRNTPKEKTGLICWSRRNWKAKKKRGVKEKRKEKKKKGKNSSPGRPLGEGGGGSIVYKEKREIQTPHRKKGGGRQFAEKRGGERRSGTSVLGAQSTREFHLPEDWYSSCREREEGEGWVGKAKRKKGEPLSKCLKGAKKKGTVS